MDISYLLWWQGLREATGGVLESVAVALSALGDAMPPLLLACAIYWCVHKSTGLFAMFGFNLGAFFNGIFKLTCCVYRPWVRDTRIVPAKGAIGGATGYSFPSGHSTNSTAVYGGVGYKSKGWLRWLLFALVLLIMLSRNVVGVHTPQDILVGALLGVAALCLTGWLLKWADGGKNRDLWAAGAALALAIVGVVFVSLKAYPTDYVGGALLVDPVAMQPDTFAGAGAMIGLFAGWLMERRLVRFDMSCKPWQKLLRFVIGAAVMALMYLVVGKGVKSLIGRNWGGLIVSAVTLFYAMGLHPLLFTAVEKRHESKTKQAPEQPETIRN